MNAERRTPNRRGPLPTAVTEALLREYGGDRVWPRLDCWSRDWSRRVYEVTITRRSEHDASAHEIVGRDWITVDDNEAERR